MDLAGLTNEILFPLTLKSLYEAVMEETTIAMPTENITLYYTFSTVLPDGSIRSPIKIAPSSEGSYELMRKKAMASSSEVYTFYLSLELKLFTIKTSAKQGIETFPAEGLPLLLNLSEPEIPSALFESLDTYKGIYARSVRPQKPVEEIEAVVIMTNKNHTKYEKIVSDIVSKESLLRVNAALCGILLRASKAYSKIDLEDLFSPKPKLIIPASLGGTSKDLIKMIGQYNEATPIPTVFKMNVNDVVIEDLGRKLNMIETYLRYFNDTIHKPNCYSEANRRIALNCLLLPVIAPPNSAHHTFVSLDAEHHMKELHNIPRIGNGPLDYFISVLPNLPPTIGGFVVAHIDDEMAGGEDEDDDAEHQQEGKEAGSDTANAVVDGGGLSPTTTSIIEAKADVKTETLKQSLGQLFAQMLDGLNLPQSRKRKRVEREIETTVAAANVEEGGGERFIKGMLSTAQQTMFFSMTKKATDQLPTLEFYGKCSVNFLPRQEGRESGLDLGQRVARAEIEKFVKFVHYFSRYDGN